MKVIRLLGLRLVVFPGVYEPAEDSLLLADVLLSVDVRGKRVLDLGCGTGFLALLAARMGAKSHAVDINPLAVACTRLNAVLNGLTVDVRLGDLFSPFREQQFDLILGNLPYLPPSELDCFLTTEDRLAVVGGDGGVDCIIRALRSLPNHLSRDGCAYFVLSSLSDVKRVLETASDLGLSWRLVATRELLDERLFIYEFRLS